MSFLEIFLRSFIDMRNCSSFHCISWTFMKKIHSISGNFFPLIVFHGDFVNKIHLTFGNVLPIIMFLRVCKDEFFDIWKCYSLLLLLFHKEVSFDIKKLLFRLLCLSDIYREVSFETPRNYVSIEWLSWIFTKRLFFSLGNILEM